MAEFSTGLQIRKEENYVISFLTSSGGKFYESFRTVALAIPPLNIIISHICQSRDYLSRHSFICLNMYFL